jgi:hypothetical protein
MFSVHILEPMRKAHDIGNEVYTIIEANPKHAAKEHYVIFEVFTGVTLNNGVFWDVMPCGSCGNRRFGGT